MSDRFILLTGCSGGGKSTLLDALRKRGYATVPEPGRRIVSEELAKELDGGGKALPWVDMRAFAQRALEMARSDLKAAQDQSGLVFFDRGIIDAAVALEHSGSQSIAATLGDRLPYARRVFLVPPWEEIFAGDAERRHDFEAAKAEYHRIHAALDRLGYQITEVPRAPVEARVDMILAQCGVPENRLVGKH